MGATVTPAPVEVTVHTAVCVVVTVKVVAVGAGEERRRYTPLQAVVPPENCTKVLAVYVEKTCEVLVTVQ